MGLETDAEDPVIQVLATSAYRWQRTICIMDNSGLILSESDANDSGSMLLVHCKTYCWLGARFLFSGQGYAIPGATQIALYRAPSMARKGA